ncbi:11985_t:CDS:2 [Funneliformis caledonium]|uniref:11985_t:CDS:1 n=1 Tax=Funneliformis caledonium TaxID=1117310 RepID=A0A9N8WAU2_9GLOM|nr:11985_t:CDS:2 [Funneliformis caledonium]
MKIRLVFNKNTNLRHLLLIQLSTLILNRDNACVAGLAVVAAVAGTKLSY